MKRMHAKYTLYAFKIGSDKITVLCGVFPFVINFTSIIQTVNLIVLSAMWEDSSFIENMTPNAHTACN